MKSVLSPCVVAVAAAVAASVPQIRPGSVTMAQATSGREVTIGYELQGEPAIVTVDILTNGVSIGEENLQYFRGDVNRKVAVGEGTIKWRPDKAWPGHKLDAGVTAVVTAWATNAPPPYMSVNLSNGGINFYPSAGAVQGGVTNDQYKTEYLLLRRIPAANVQWRMGSPNGEAWRKTDEKARLVTLSDDFYLGVYEFTQRQYELVKGTHPTCAFANMDDYATRPLEGYSYINFRGSVSDGYDWPANGHAVHLNSVLGRLRALVGNACLFDLPLEAQWEFACRAGTGTALYTGRDLSDENNDPKVNVIGRGKYNGGCGADGTVTNPGSQVRVSEAGTNKVGSYLPNAFGLYDMIGNVWEYCVDWYAADLDGVDPEVGPASGTRRVTRGGCWNSGASWMRSAFRNNPFAPDNGNRCFGFRICCPPGIN